MTKLAHHLSRLLVQTEPGPDGDLLDRFLANRDEAAFAELVRRHGPMVLAVCLRILRHQQDAEDAFQATFLVLARRAEMVRPQSTLGNWLYGVAYRTAVGARRVAAVRKAHEVKAGAMRTTELLPDDNGLSTELREALDRELAALPDAYRAAVVACDLEGLSRQEAAAHLQWSAGTLSSRLSRARSLLARRLARFGLVIPATGLTAAGTTAVAGSLAVSTVRLGTLMAVGEAAVAGPIAAMMEGTMKAMLLTKLKALTTAGVVGCAMLVTAAAGWQAEAGAGDPPADRAKAAEAPRKGRDADKDRIAELERERDQLRKEVAELRERLAASEAERKLSQLKAAEGVYAQALRAAGQKPEDRPTQGTVVRPAPLVGSVKPPRETSNNTPPATPAVGIVPAGQATPSFPEAASRLHPTVPAAVAKVSVQVYPVSELAADEKEGEALAKVVRSTVDPKSWGTDAGVEFLPGRKVMVVRQTARGHEEVAELLRLLHKTPAPAGPKVGPSTGER